MDATSAMPSAPDDHAAVYEQPPTLPSELISDEQPPTLLTLPSELISSIAYCLKGSHVLTLAQSHRSLSFLTQGCSDELWRDKLRSELGFTQAGMKLWSSKSGRRLFEAYDFLSRKHEPLECSLLSEPKAASALGWPRCVDLKLCIELVNPWPEKVWTLFRVCSSCSGAATREAEPWDDLEPAADLEPSRQQLHLWSHSSARLQCIGYAAPGDKDAVVVSFAAAPGKRENLADVSTRHLPATPSGGPTASVGWMLGGEELRTAVPTVQAMLLPACRPATRASTATDISHGEAEGDEAEEFAGRAAGGRRPALVVLGEHTLRVDENSFTREGELCLEVMQVRDLRAYGLSVPLEEVAPFELCCDADAEVPTTANRSDLRRGQHNRHLAGRDFEWRDNAHASHEHSLTAEKDATDSNVCSLPGGTHVVDVVQVVDAEVDISGEATPRAGEPLRPVSFVPLCRTLVFIPLRAAGSCAPS